MTPNDVFELMRYFGTETDGVWRFSKKNIEELIASAYIKGRQRERDSAVEMCLKLRRKSNLLAESAETVTAEAVARGSASAGAVMAEILMERVI